MEILQKSGTHIFWLTHIHFLWGCHRNTFSRRDETFTKHRTRFHISQFFSVPFHPGSRVLPRIPVTTAGLAVMSAWKWGGKRSETGCVQQAVVCSIDFPCPTFMAVDGLCGDVNGRFRTLPLDCCTKLEWGWSMNEFCRGGVQPIRGRFPGKLFRTMEIRFLGQTKIDGFVAYWMFNYKNFNTLFVY